jgi:propionyl-CoA carboxylase beta chain
MITLITRKAYGGAYDVMASKHIGADITLAYPTSEIAVMGAEGAVNIIFRKELAGLEGKAFDEKKAELVTTMKKILRIPYKAASLGYVDEVIFQRNEKSIAYYLDFFRDKNIQRPKRKHGNIPL